MKPIYFCFGDFRTGEKQYRIFKVRNVDDAYKVADELGYQIVLDNCIKAMHIPDVEERTIVSILQTIEIKQKEVENVVSCYRQEYDEAQRMKRHFLESDMALYFPKKLAEPVEHFIDGKSLKFTQREQPWITEYWERKYRESNQRYQPVRVLSTDTMIMQNAAIREKTPPE
jgi:predicted nucleotidyltransferase